MPGLMKEKSSVVFKHKAFFSALLFLFLYVLLSWRHLTGNNFFGPDADRISMDGVFLMDFFRDLPGSLFNIYEYTTHYYARYPALSIGYRPIFFQLVVSFFYMVTGISCLGPKLAVFCFLFAGVFFWLKLVEKIYDYPTAVLSAILWLTTPIIFMYSQMAVLEIPTLAMCIVAVYTLYTYESEPDLFHGICLGLATGLTLWTNQKSGFVLIILVLYPVMRTNIALFARKNTWITVLIILVFLVPLALLTIWLGDQNLSQSVGHIYEKETFLSKYRPFEHLKFFVEHHFNTPMMAMIFLGIFYCLIKRDSRSFIFGLSIVCIYVFFTIIRIKEPRFTIYWIPFFSLFAAITITHLFSVTRGGKRKRRSYILYGLFIMVLAYNLTGVSKMKAGYANGFETAARYSMAHTKSPVIFYEGHANGQFIFFVRKHDETRAFVVLRGSKIISSSSVFKWNKLQIHLPTKQAIYQSLKEMGVHFIVVEARDKSNLPIYREFRTLLQDTSKFKLHRSINVESNLKSLSNQTLLIYENLSWEEHKQDKILTLRLPIVGKTIQVKLNQLTE